MPLNLGFVAFLQDAFRHIITVGLFVDVCRCCQSQMRW